MTHSETIALFAAVLIPALVACGTDDGGCFINSDCPAGRICMGGSCVVGQGVLPGDSNQAVLPPAGDATVRLGDRFQAIPDVIGPEITIISPAPYELVSGWIDIIATVTDRTGVDVTRVGARILDQFDVQLGPGPLANTFIAEFNTEILPFIAYPTITVDAYDVLGNSNDAGHEFALDNMPPLVSLNSPDFQPYRDGEFGGIECGRFFNPLGPNRLQHGQVINPFNDPYRRFFIPRVRIEDRGNGSAPGLFYPIAGTNDATTKLYLLDSIALDQGERLLLGAGPGSACNRINPNVIPDVDGRLPRQAIVQDLVPIPPKGEPDFTSGGPVNPPCDRDGAVPPPAGFYIAPQRLCDVSEKILIWIGYNTDVDPAVYVINEYDEDNLITCIGGQFDSRNFGQDGVVCLAGVAEDNLGRLGISAPIAVCIDRDGVGNECLGFDATASATQLCTDGCVSDDYPPFLTMYPFNRGLF